MKLEPFLAQRSPEWSELEALVARYGVSGPSMSAAELRRLGALYRAAAADLAVARRCFPDARGTWRLQALVASA
ncbi:MAG TPA: hypothetical protein VMF60_01870, partial [Acidimicrobiales bacterium]|nr:hypothetical protein [Acidimicrobiales bacterium]